MSIYGALLASLDASNKSYSSGVRFMMCPICLSYGPAASYGRPVIKYTFGRFKFPENQKKILRKYKKYISGKVN